MSNLVDSSDVVRDQNETRAAKLREELAQLEQDQTPAGSALAKAQTIAKSADHKDVAASAGLIVEALEKFGRVNTSPDAVQESYEAWLSHNPHEDEGFRRERATKKVQEGFQAAQDAAANVAATVGVVVNELRRQALPEVKASAEQQGLLRDELRMLLDGLSQGELFQGALSLLEDFEHSGPETAILASRWGRSYFASRGQRDAHDAVRSAILSRAAEHGTGRERAAATAVRKIQESGLAGWAGPAAKVLVDSSYGQLPRGLRAAVGL